MDSRSNLFYASLDKTAKLITIGVCLALLAIMIRAIFYFGTNPVSAVISTILSVGVLGYCLLYRPLNYVLTMDSLIIHRLIKNVVVPRSEITKVRLVTKQELSGLIRVFGVGGLFGYFGIFSNKSGDVYMYATNMKNSIMIETPSRNFIITPNDSSAFLHEFQ